MLPTCPDRLIGRWFRFKSGCWAVSVCAGFGGTHFKEHVPGFGWCIAHEGMPRKHVQRRLLKKAFRNLARRYRNENERLHQAESC